jgi:hypothetical protein
MASTAAKAAFATAGAGSSIRSQTAVRTGAAFGPSLPSASSAASRVFSAFAVNSFAYLATSSLSSAARFPHRQSEAASSIVRMLCPIAVASDFAVQLLAA